MLVMQMEIIGGPEVVERAGRPGVQPSPGLALATPMKQTDGAGVQAPAATEDVVAAEAVLVPAVMNGLNVPAKDKQEWGERAQLINPPLPLHLHPPLDPPREAPLPPPPQIHHHHPRVEVARILAQNPRREGGVGPEGVREVAGEVGAAVLGGGDDAAAGDRPELADVVHEDEVGVEVDDAVDEVGVENVGQVVAGVVEGVVQGGSDGGGDEVGDEGGVEWVQLEVEGGEGGADEGGEGPGVGMVRLGVDQVEEDVFWAGGVLDDGVDGADGTPDVLGVQGHGDVDRRGAAVVVGAFWPIAVLGGLGESGQSREMVVFLEGERADGVGGREEEEEDDEDDDDDEEGPHGQCLMMIRES
ncbi:hypothetical protein Sjap_015954 [Stephania japonica]|uniref:Uncharacterized protein n=1 Tax=Stephania japonica TaxID=461633 RepID=A0AAP0NRD2_9MAGN